MNPKEGSKLTYNSFYSEEFTVEIFIHFLPVAIGCVHVGGQVELRTGFERRGC